MPKALPRKSPEEVLKERLLEAGVWTVGKIVTFASGREANNHLDIPSAAHGSFGRRAMVGRLLFRFFEHNADAIWGVPNGAQEIADEVAEIARVPLIRLRKVKVEPGLKTFAYASPTDAVNAARVRRAVGLEDVTTEMTSLHGALYGDQSKGGEGIVPGLLQKTVALEAVWRRGTAETERILGLPIHWLIEQPLPDIITPDHPFFREYGHLAIGELVRE